MEAEGLMSELDDIMAQLEAKYGRRLPHGYNPNLHFMSHLWEPLRHMYRCAIATQCRAQCRPLDPASNCMPVAHECSIMRSLYEMQLMGGGGTVMWG